MFRLNPDGLWEPTLGGLGRLSTRLAVPVTMKMAMNTQPISMLAIEANRMKKPSLIWFVAIATTASTMAIESSRKPKPNSGVVTNPATTQIHTAFTADDLGFSFDKGGRGGGVA